MLLYLHERGFVSKQVPSTEERARLTSLCLCLTQVVVIVFFYLNRLLTWIIGTSPWYLVKSVYGHMTQDL
jgi:hypothetical protein